MSTPSTVAFVWEAVEEATTYHLQLALNGVFAELVHEDTTLANPEIKVGPLSYETEYHWRVRARNGDGWRPWSEQRSFTVAVGTASDEELDLPATYELAAAYPNPFNPRTVIGFALPEPGDVRLAVYDLLAREVALILDEQQPAGRHEAAFEASGLPSGVYVYRITAGSFTQVRRMVLVK